MTAHGQLFGWAFVLFVVVGFFLAYLRARKWYNSRTWDDVVIRTREE